MSRAHQVWQYLDPSIFNRANLRQCELIANSLLRITCKQPLAELCGHAPP